VIRRNLIALAALTCGLALPATAQADFGIEAGSVKVQALNKNGTPATLASTHPYAFTVSFNLKTEASGKTEGGTMRDAIVTLPPGLIGNPRVVPSCPRQSFEGAVPNCPPSTQVGTLKATLVGVGEVRGPIYNIAPPPGAAAQLGFGLVGFNVLQFASVDTEGGYGLRVASLNAPLEVSAATETIWGTPADPSHDPERGPIAEELGLKSDAKKLAYLTMPASCEAAPEIKVKVNSKQNPGVYSKESTTLKDSQGNPEALSGCGSVPFSPSFSSQPTTKLSENPSGLDFELKLPNQGLTSPGLTAETEPRKTVVTLPEGVTVNPSVAEGIGVCAQAQYEAEKIDTPAGAGCPESSKLGSVIAQSPLLEEPVEGSVYLATPYENEFGTLNAIYLVARAQERGILVKQAGKVELDEATGQIKTTFEHLPPLPYSSFKLHFREGARAPLATPSACGEYKTTARFTPFSAKDDTEAIERTASFQIERGADGGACPSGGLPPFKPGLIAGSINNAAGRFSPFNLRLFRTDSEQEFTRFSIKLPPGITAKLVGVPYCPESGIAQAIARKGPHGGQEEIEDPSCPAASEIGHSLAGAGVGQALAYAPGKLYLAGPYNGSNLSLVAITAAKVGPFDLGTVVIRQAFKIDPETAEVFIDATGSDPIPHIIKGIAVHARDIRAYTDRPDFVLNPTSCTRTSTASTLLGSGLDFSSEADDRPVTVSTPYQAADCASLPFKPRLGLKLKGGTTRGSHPAFKAHLEMSGIGEAGIRKAQVVLPRSEFIENKHIRTICTRVQFKAGGGNGEQCPPGSIYGKARASTPILAEPLEGPVFLRSNGNERSLPDLVVALHNSQVDFDLVGFIDSVKGGGIRNTFSSAPDAPVSSFDLEMAGGKKGLLVNSQDLCAKTRRAEATFTGQNGKVYESKPALKVTCKGKHGRKR